DSRCAASACGSRPPPTTSRAPATHSASATRTTMGVPPTGMSALSRPMRRLLPPHRTAPLERGVPGTTPPPPAAVARLDAPALPVAADGRREVRQELVGHRRV